MFNKCGGISNVVLQITLRCNTVCANCNVMVGVRTPKDSDMTLEQIQKFIDQTTNRYNRTREPLNMIQVMGGEPTIHKDITKIYEMLFFKLVYTNIVKKIIVQSNGINKINHPAFQIVPPEIKQHINFYESPSELKLEQVKCYSPERCGIAVNAFGYFPCGAGYSLINLLDFQDQIYYDFPDDLKIWDYNKICPHCCHSIKEPVTYPATINHLTVPKSNIFKEALSKPPRELKRL